MRRGLLATLALLSLGACKPAQRPLLVGLAGPFTDPVGIPMQLAAELAVEEINAAGGVGGRPIQLVIRDDDADPDRAVAAAANLVAAGVVAVIGHVFSGTTLAAAPVYGSASPAIPVITPSSSAPEIREAGAHVFRLCPTDLDHGAALASWVRRGLGLSRGSVLYLNDSYGRGVRTAFASRFVGLGGQVMSADPYLGDTPDVAAYLDRARTRDSVEFLVVAGNRAEAVEVLRLARASGLNVPILGGDGLEGIEAAGSIANGVYLTAAYLPAIESAINRRFVQAYQARYPEAGAPNQPAAAAYDALYLLSNVMAARGTSRRAIMRGLSQVGRELPAHQGVTGMLAFDERGELARIPILIGVARDGKIEIADRQ